MHRATSLRAALAASGDFQIHQRDSVLEARGPLAAGAFEVCLLAPADAGDELAGAVAALRSAGGSMPLVVLPPADADLGLQGALISAGADSVLYEPVSVGPLATHLARLAARHTPAPSAPTSGSASPLPTQRPATSKAAALSTALEILRDFSRVLGYSLDHRQLTQHFALKLRELLGISRVVVFLEPGDHPSTPTSAVSDDGRLPCAAAVGLPTDLAECFSLTRKSGLGRQVCLQPQILRAQDPFNNDTKIAREFEILGGLVAIPVTDRERTLGVAVLGGRITGGDFSDEELLLVYHLLEELGLAIKNSWLHRQLVSGHRLLGQVLDGLTTGAAVVGPDQRITYANRGIVSFLGVARSNAFDIHDLPGPIALRVHEAVEKGAEITPFFHRLESAQPRDFRVNLIPLSRPDERPPRTILLLLEDFTQILAAQRSEIEASNLKLTSLIARRFAHEIRNSLVPLSTHEQLFEAEIEQVDFRDSLRDSLRRETKRIRRFTDQMLLFGRSEGDLTSTPVVVEDLLRESFAKALEDLGGEGRLEICGRSDRPVSADRARLGHAFREIFLNSLQSGTGPVRQASVTLTVTNDLGAPGLRIDFRDDGPGFSPEAAARAAEPFFTTRNTGIGLGLTLARQVIEAHAGTLQVRLKQNPADPDLSLQLPLTR